MLVSVIILISLIFLSLVASLIWSKVWVGIKAVLILATLAIAAFSVWTIQDARGTPSTKPLPQEFLLASTLIREPNKSKNDPGAIYYVIIEYVNGLAIPRTYERPYSNKRHSQTSQIQSAIDKTKGPVWVKNQNNDDISESEQGAKGAQGVTKKVSKAAKNAARGLGLYDDDSNSDLKLDSANPLPSKE